MNHTPELAEAFISRMRDQLGSEELSAFLRTQRESPIRGIRLNPMKRADGLKEYRTQPPIPWALEAYELPPASEAGSTILHEAGAFYLQEPGAMLPAAVLDPQPGEYILDLCAAPGGKSTQIGLAMKGEGLLVCNEPIPKRAKVLSGNVERMGIPNAIVTCAWPAELANRWFECFDAVMVDAPCSGEGMFRRLPESRLEWSSENAEGCVRRQLEILDEAAKLVRPGGRLVYATCTYNPEENEMNCGRFLQSHQDFEPEPFELKNVSAPEGRFLCYPHRLRTEGQFAAKFRKKGKGGRELPGDSSLPRIWKEAADMLRNAFPMLPAATHQWGQTLIDLPICPDLQGIRVLRAGMHLGEMRGKMIIPDHAVALSFFPPNTQSLDLSPEEARRYIAGETIQADMEGWCLMRYRNLILGWGKGSGGMIRNHYPKGLRKSNIKL